LIGRDDSLIAKYGLTKAGFGHTTENVIRGNNDGLPIEAFIHRCQTQRTETYTDCEGYSHPHRDREPLRDRLRGQDAILISVAFGGRRLGGKKVRFESEEFNERFTGEINVLRSAHANAHRAGR
jgi:hypothetical protein